MQATTVDPNQKYLLMAMPFVFVLFVKNFPAARLVIIITYHLAQILLVVSLVETR